VGRVQAGPLLRERSGRREESGCRELLEHAGEQPSCDARLRRPFCQPQLRAHHNTATKANPPKAVRVQISMKMHKFTEASGPHWAEQLE
jgi:hypothetical protein